MFKFDDAFRAEFKANWLLLIIAFSCLLFGMSAGAFSLPFVFPEVIREFGWTREQATLLATAKYLTMSVSALLTGRLLDFIGTWITLIFMIVLMGISLLSFLWIDGLTQYYITGIILGFATGGGIVTVKVMISKAFHTSQGTAMGIALLGTALGATIFPLLITTLISALGWRQGFAVLSLAIWAITIPLLLVGYFRYAGKKDEGQQRYEREARSGYDLAPRIVDLLPQLNFWVIAFVVFLAGVIDTGFVQHQVLILQDYNFSKNVIAVAVSMIGFIGIGCRALVGNILDSKSNKGLAAIYSLMGFAALLAMFLINPFFLMVFVVLRAVGHAAVLLDTTVMTKHAFGNSRNLGTMLGLFTGCSSAGYAMGPWLMARVSEAAGSYRAAFIVFIGLTIVLVGLTLMIKPVYWQKINQKA